jgi:hypothetical protein
MLKIIFLLEGLRLLMEQIIGLDQHQELLEHKEHKGLLVLKELKDQQVLKVR